MRQGVLLVLCFALLLAAGATVSEGAALIPPRHGSTGSQPASPIPPPHGAVAFWDLKRGLVGSGSAACPGVCGNGLIQATTDSGKTWKTVLKTRDAVIGLDTAGRGAAWAVTQRCQMLVCHSSLWRSTNSGRAWSAIGSGFTGVGFATPSQGLGVKATETETKVYRSTNGGSSWTPVANPCTEAAPTGQSLSVLSPDHAFLVCAGQSAAGAENKFVYETLTGGRTWTRKIRAELGSGTFSSLPTSGFVSGAAFAPTGFGAMCQTAGVFLVTRNGGRTWAPIKVVRPRIDNCLAVSLVPGVTYAVIRTRNRDRIVMSTNGGGKWTLVKRF